METVVIFGSNGWVPCEDYLVEDDERSTPGPKITSQPELLRAYSSRTQASRQLGPPALTGSSARHLGGWDEMLRMVQWGGVGVR